MQIGTSLILIAVGAILRFAVTESVSGIDLQVVGLILMIVGVIGLVITLVYSSSRRSGAVREREVVRERPRDRY